MNEPQIDWAKANFRFRMRQDAPHPLEPVVDEVVSQIVGKKIYQLDPRLTKLILKWKKAKQGGDDTPDNFLKDSKKIEELKTELCKSL
jgi:hypothetical protein